MAFVNAFNTLSRQWERVPEQWVDNPVIHDRAFQLTEPGASKPDAPAAEAAAEMSAAKAEPVSKNPKKKAADSDGQDPEQKE